MRLQPDGSWQPAIIPEEIGLLYRPIVTQISRWDYLKGFRPLLESFVLLKRQLQKQKDLSERARRRTRGGFPARSSRRNFSATLVFWANTGPCAFNNKAANSSSFTTSATLSNLEKLSP